MRRSSAAENLVLTGVGILCSLGQGKDQVLSRLVNGDSSFQILRREGRQAFGSTYLGAEIESLQIPEGLAARHLRTVSLSTKAALCAISEAWQEADLNGVDPRRIGLVVGGSNFQQREMVLKLELALAHHRQVLPSYALTFMDSDLCGTCSEHFGGAHTVGGASASGQLAVMEAAEAVRSGRVDVCVAVGALMDLSHFECSAFRSVGAMGSDRYAERPSLACRPFDRDSDGFIYGESCAAIVVERAGHERSAPYASLLGWKACFHATRGPEPSLDGEVTAIREALADAGMHSGEIDYVNPHGSGSAVGDQIELEALRQCGLSHAYINTSKSLLGHGMTSAGAVEIGVTLLQMRKGILHPSLNLKSPVHNGHRWVTGQAVHHHVTNALCLSHGFGGISSAICLRNEA
jgi:malonyl-ACP decarboxylase